MPSNFRVSVRWFMACCIALGFLAAPKISNGQGAQIQESGLRIVEDTGLSLVSKRPKARKPTRLRRRYKILTPAGTGAPAHPWVELGVTIWRLRPATEKDDVALRFLDQADEEASPDARPKGLTAERLDGTTQLREGDRVRLSIEAAQSGFLYIIDREQYSDGTLGEPYLIFPNTQTHGGDNRVKAGSVIEIPGQNDRNSFYTIRLKQTAGGRTLAGDVLTLLITPQPLTGFEIPRRVLKLTAEQMAAWEKWNVMTEKLDLIEGGGQTYTKAEKQAGTDPLRFLDQGDPLPQTIFRVAAKPGSPFLVTVPLVVSKLR